MVIKMNDCICAIWASLFSSGRVKYWFVRPDDHGLIRQSLNGTGNGNLINTVLILSHCNGNGNLCT